MKRSGLHAKSKETKAEIGRAESQLRNAAKGLATLMNSTNVTLGADVVAHLKRVNGLIGQVRSLATRSIIMPIEEIQLAVELAKEAGTTKPSQESVIFPLMVPADDDNFHIRRVAINTFRRIGNFSVDGLLDLIVKKLKDPHPWVQYDAAWAIETSGIRRPGAIKALRQIIGRENIVGSAPDPGDAVANARWRAAVALQKLGEPFET